MYPCPRDIQRYIHVKVNVKTFKCNYNFHVPEFYVKSKDNEKGYFSGNHNRRQRKRPYFAWCFLKRLLNNMNVQLCSIFINELCLTLTRSKPRSMYTF